MTDEEAWKVAVENLGLGYQLATRFYWSHKKHGQSIGSALVDECRSAVPEVLFKAAKKFDPSRGFKFSTYAGTALWRAFISIERKERRATAREATWADEEGSTPSLDPAEVSSVLAAGGLTELERAVVHAHYVVGLTLMETARCLDVSLNSVKGGVDRALPKLRHSLDPGDLRDTGLDSQAERRSPGSRPDSAAYDAGVEPPPASVKVSRLEGHDPNIPSGAHMVEGSILDQIRHDPDLAKKRLANRRRAEEDAKSMERWYAENRVRREKAA